MAESYVPILAAFGFGCFVAVLFMGLSYYISKKQGQCGPDEIKYTTYECGIPPKTNSRMRFSVGFYLVALVFILFDIEAVFMYPWANSFRELSRDLGVLPLLDMLVFILILLVGFVYVWKVGVLDWARRARTQGREEVG